MSTDRTVRLNPADLALKLACADAVHAAGGQVLVAGETGKSQSRISDYCSPNTDQFMPIDVVRRVEAMAVGSAGWPQITRALARAQAGSFVAHGSEDLRIKAATLGAWLGEVGAESGDLLAVLAQANLAGPVSDLSPAQRAKILHEVDEALDALTGLRAALLVGDSS